MEMHKWGIEKKGFVFAIIFILISYGCKLQNVDKGILECFLRSIKIEKDNMILQVGQHNGLTDSSTLITIYYHKESNESFIRSGLVGDYNGNKIYFYHSNLDTNDNKRYEKIPNKIKWKSITHKPLDEDYISPPYDPIRISFEYNNNRNCVEKIYANPEIIDEKILSECKCQK